MYPSRSVSRSQSLRTHPVIRLWESTPRYESSCRTSARLPPPRPPPPAPPRPRLPRPRPPPPRPLAPPPSPYVPAAGAAPGRNARLGSLSNLMPASLVMLLTTRSLSSVSRASIHSGARECSLRPAATCIVVGSRPLGGYIRDSPLGAWPPART